MQSSIINILKQKIHDILFSHIYARTSLQDRNSKHNSKRIPNYNNTRLSNEEVRVCLPSEICSRNIFPPSIMHLYCIQATIHEFLFCTTFLSLRISHVLYICSFFFFFLHKFQPHFGFQSAYFTKNSSVFSIDKLDVALSALCSSLPFSHKKPNL